jgi:hypothetical protein
MELAELFLLQPCPRRTNVSAAFDVIASRQEVRTNEICYIRHFQATTTLKTSSLNIGDICYMRHFQANTTLKTSSLNIGDICYMRHFQATTTLKTSSLNIGDTSDLSHLPASSVKRQGVCIDTLTISRRPPFYFPKV